MRSSTGKTKTARRNKAVVLFGPTAVGKTALTEELFSSGFEIVNADSVQVYRGLDIGSAKPGSRLRVSIPHHQLCISDISSRSHIPLITGGTAYYFRSLVYGPSAAPPSDEAVRIAVRQEMERKGIAWAHSYLASVDPVSASRIAIGDTYRISRAIEVYRCSGQPLSSFALPSRPRSDIDFIIIGLDRDRTELRSRIRERVDEMFREGLYDEIRRLMDMGAGRAWPAMRAIGYREFLDAAESGEVSLPVIKDDIVRSTCQYAKRQMTFFSSFTAARFFHPGDSRGIREYLSSRGIGADGLVS